MARRRPLVQQPGGVQHQPARLVDLDAWSASHSCTLLCSDSGLPRRGAPARVLPPVAGPARTGQWCACSGAPAPAPGAPAPWQSPAPIAQQRSGGHAHVVQANFAMPFGRVVVQHMDVAHHLHPGVPTGTSTMLWRWWLSGSALSSASALRHSTMSNWHCGCAAPVMNHLRPLSTRVSPAAPLRSPSPHGGLQVGGVGRGHVRLAHRKGRPALAVQQWLQPLGALRRAGEAVQQFDVAGVRALQLNTSAAQGRRPMASASGA